MAEYKVMKRLRLSKDKCIGCRLCAVVCSAYKEGEYRPARARIDISSHYGEDGLLYDEKFCINCGICAKNCPVGAISFEEFIVVDHEKCIGCSTCAEKCPKKAVHIRGGKSYICDTCMGAPNCIRTCPQQALTLE